MKWVSAISVQSLADLNQVYQNQSQPFSVSYILRGILFIVRVGNEINKADLMHTKRTTFPTEKKIGIHLEEQKYCTEISTFLLPECSPIRKTNMFKNADFYRANWQNATLMHFHAIVPDIRSSGEPENILTTNYG